MKSKVLLPLLLGLLAIITAQAQVNGRLSGTVVDPAGAAVTGAKVDLILAAGTSGLLSTETNGEGYFSLPSVRPELYRVTITAPGFRSKTVNNVEVVTEQERSLGQIPLELGAVTEVVEVSTSTQAVQTTSAEVSTVITNEQLRGLPTINRSPISLLLTQPGVTTNNRSNITINGQRVSFTNVTLDGVNIQDNFIRSNAIDFQPNLLLLDQVVQANVSTSNLPSSAGGGSGQINFISPSGSDHFHGAVFESNRNSALAANTWFNNRDGIAKPRLNQNQFGGHLGGYVVKDKLFFYGTYERLMLRQQSSNNTTVLTDDARKGIYTYTDTASRTVKKVNILQLTGVQIDPAIATLLQGVPTPDKINNFRLGDSNETLLRNTGGYSFLLRNNRTRVNITGKLDYNLSTKHVFTASYSYNRDAVDRPDQSNDFSMTPKVTNEEAPKLASISWRWTPSPSTTNEVRAGFNLTTAPFLTSEQFGPYILGGLSFSNPVNTFRAQGRETNTYTLQDNANTVKGRHTLQYGFFFQRNTTEPYNDAGITPIYTLGISANNKNGLNNTQLSGASAADVNAANALLATLAGYVSSYTQTFNITSRDSGYVKDATNKRFFSQNNWALYFNDTWKATKRVTLSLGLRYEYYTVLDERDSLFLLPKGNIATALAGNATWDFAGKSVGKPWYNADRNNFAPNIGMAWDVFGNGKTAIRGGYSVSFVNDENIASIRNSVTTNSGLTTSVTAAGLTGRLTGSLPSVPTPVFQVPRTTADNYDISSTNAQAAVSPDLRTPYVQQFSIGIQQEVKGTIFDVRYVGNHGTKLYRAIDLNQVDITTNGFLPDFNRAYTNATLAQAAGRGFDPSYSTAVAGSQPLPVFNKLASSGLLTNATIRNLIQTQQVGELASVYQTNGLNGSINFFPNPLELGANLFTNYTNSTYNGLQVDVRHRTRSGVQLQGNYVFSKALSDSSGDAQSRFEAFLDNNNAKIERARLPFDNTHVIKGNGVYELPFGRGHALNSSNGLINRLIGGWQIGSILNWQSGSPFSILSGRGTLNRGGRSTATNTVTSSVDKGELDKIIGFRMTGNGPYLIAQSAINPADGRGVAPDGQPDFQGQVFHQPTAGTLGALQRRMFSGPWNFALDLSVQKTTHLTERQSLELRIDSTNALNHPTFDITGDYTVTSTSFGRLTSTATGRRLVQLTLFYRF